MQEEQLDLGPLWLEIELEVFLKIFRQSGITPIAIQKMQDTLRQLGYHRTTQQLLSVYRKNKNFLESNQNCNQHDLYLILKDQYEVEVNPIKKVKKNIKNNYRKYRATKFIQFADPLKEISQANCSGAVLQIDDQIITTQSQQIRYEYFYSHLDYTYFNLNEFHQMMKKVDIDIGLKPISEWRKIKKALGTTRRFSAYFIKQENQRLQSFRSIIRNYLFDQNYKIQIQRDIKNNDLLYNIVRLNQFTPRQAVYAIHPHCKHIHTGRIIHSDLPQVQIQFDQEDLGTHKVHDYLVQLEEKFSSQQVAENRLDMQKQLIQNNQPEGKNAQIVQDLDNYAASMLILILQRYDSNLYQRKQCLIDNLRKINDKTEKDQNPDPNLKDVYKWTVRQIKAFEQAERDSQTKFRLRGLKAYQCNQIEGNLKHVLSMPQRYMERELEQTDEGFEDQKKLEIRQFFQKTQDDKMKQEVAQIFKGKFPQNGHYDSRYFPLIQTLIGILVTLKNQGDINLRSNPYIQILENLIGYTHKQEFEEIKDIIDSLINNHNR
ncbi:hypothetical protein pb186bvf_006465 [Paramecium bursaria]